MTAAEKILTAQNARAINAILDDGEAVIRSGSHWAFTIRGDVRASGTFAEVRYAAAKYNDI